MNTKQALEFNLLVNMLCELLQLSKFNIYFIKYSNDNIIIYDNVLNVISYDERDILINKVEQVVALYKENTIYINTSMLKYTTKAKILIIRQIRKLYQLKQINLLINKQSLSDQKETIESWLYCFNMYSKNKKYSATSPSELDCNAFADYIMRIIYKQAIAYDIKTNERNETERYDKCYSYIIKKYDIDHIKVIAKSYKLI